MDRNAEYDALRRELDAPPPELAYAVARARARMRHKKTRRLLGIPVAGTIALIIAFVVSVNLSVSFARACGRLPVLRELASAVAFSPSLSAAVKNQYVQPIDQEQTQNGITMRIEYVIVDQKQLNIFYTLQSPLYSRMDAELSVHAADGSPLESYMLGADGGERRNGAIRRSYLAFVDLDMPPSLQLTLRVRDLGPETADAPVAITSNAVPEPPPEPDALAECTFLLSFDPTFMQRGEVIELNRAFELDGQRMTLQSAEIYPTHIRLNVDGDPDNTAWISSLALSLVNERGERFESATGISATGAEDSPAMRSFWLDSPFFSHSEHLTLHIAQVTWLDKSMRRTEVDLANGTATNLPDGVALQSAQRTDDGWAVAFTARARAEGVMHQVFSGTYHDPDGGEHHLNSWSTGGFGYYDEAAQTYVDTPDRFQERFTFVDYPYDTVFLDAVYTRMVDLDAPVVIEVK